MPTLKDLNLPDLMNNSVRDVFETMLSMEIKAVEVPSDHQPGTAERIIGVVGLAGPFQGAVYFHLAEPFALHIASTMLGMAPEELGHSEVNDVVGELTNMIGGNIKSRLSDAGFRCNLSVPSVVRGTDIDIETVELDSGRKEQRVFVAQEQVVQLVVAIKEGSVETTV